MALIIYRVGKQRLREARTQAVDYLILLLAGICLGTLAKVSDESFGSLGYTYTVIAVCKFKLPFSSILFNSSFHNYFILYSSIGNFVFLFWVLLNFSSAMQDCSIEIIFIR